MKALLLLGLVLNTLFATYNITCKGDLKADTIYNFSQFPNITILAIGAELEDDYLYGDIDPANSVVTFYDDTSPVCGGSGTSNIIIDAYCSWELDHCWDVTIGSGTQELLTVIDGLYTNNTILVNSYPCMPRNTTNFSFGAYDVNDNSDLGIGNANLSAIEEEYITTPTPQEAKAQREACKEPDLISYIDEWEDLLSQQKTALQNMNSKVDMNERDLSLNNLDTTLPTYDTYIDSLDITNELSNFTTTFQSTIENSFNNHANIFGFGNYGTAPSAITFTLLGHTYSAFDVTTFDEQIPFIRNTLLAFSYVWGVIIVSRMEA